uniref:DUF834 domain-containing protein n=1 Tax=Oryza glumipatula TaxID=40148 RepID=A0A0E0AQP3_9ORYZ
MAEDAVASDKLWRGRPPASSSRRGMAVDGGGRSLRRRAPAWCSAWTAEDMAAGDEPGEGRGGGGCDRQQQAWCGGVAAKDEAVGNELRRGAWTTEDAAVGDDLRHAAWTMKDAAAGDDP